MVSSIVSLFTSHLPTAADAYFLFLLRPTTAPVSVPVPVPVVPSVPSCIKIVATVAAATATAAAAAVSVVASLAFSALIVAILSLSSSYRFSNVASFTVSTVVWKKSKKSFSILSLVCSGRALWRS